MSTPVTGTNTAKPDKDTAHRTWQDAIKSVYLEPAQKATITDAINALFESSTVSYNPAIPSIIGGVTNEQRELLIKLWNEGAKDGSLAKAEENWNSRPGTPYRDFTQRVLPKIEALVKTYRNADRDAKRARQDIPKINAQWKQVKIDCGCMVFYRDIGTVYTVCPSGHGRVLTTDKILKSVREIAKK